MTTIINSTFVNRIRNHLIKMTKQVIKDNLEELVDAEKFPGIKLVIKPLTNTGTKTYVKMNDFVLGLSLEELCANKSERVIAVTLAKAIHSNCGTIETLVDVLNGLKLYQPLETKLGLTIHYNHDVHHHALMVQETGGLKRTIFAMEEGVNTEMSMSPDLLTAPGLLKLKVLEIMGDYILTDLVTNPIDLEATLVS